MAKIRCPFLLSFGHAAWAVQRQLPSNRTGAACLVSSADRCSVPSVRACVPCLAWSALHLVRPALLSVVRSPSGCAGAQGTPAGHIAAAQPRPVSLSTTEKNKKGSKNHPTPIANLKISRKNKKDPYKGSVFCAILALQALKWRNL